jgi:repressor LexA
MIMARPTLVTKEQVIALSTWFIRHSVPPTVEELRRLLRVGSTRTVLRYLDMLEGEGYIERWSGARGLRMRKGPATKGLETRPVPIVGEAPAGQLTLAEENIMGQVQIPKDFLKPPGAKFFLLRVRGDSMNRAKVEGQSIEGGDLVLVRQQERSDPGKIIVALVDGEATIKKLAKGPGYYVLQPESTNPKNRPIIVAQDFRVQGIVCRVFKKGAELVHPTEE